MVRNVWGREEDGFGAIWREILEMGDTLFWHEEWVGNRSLRLAFPRLSHLCINKEGNIRGMGEWVGGREMGVERNVEERAI